MYVYVVNGSEDGVLGVYTNKSKAMERAIRYVTGETADIIDKTMELVDIDKRNEWLTFVEPKSEFEDVIRANTGYGVCRADVERFIPNED